MPSLHTPPAPSTTNLSTEPLKARGCTSRPSWAGGCLRLSRESRSAETPRSRTATPPTWRSSSPRFRQVTPTGMAGAALLGGNTVVLKPPPETAATGVEIARILLESGVRAGAINLVHGDAPTGRALV